MKKLIVLLSIVALTAAFSLTPALACIDCPPEGGIKGKFSRDTAAFQVDGDYRERQGEVTLNDGAMAYGEESSSGKYSAEYSAYRRDRNGYVIGGTGGLGGTHVGAYDTRKSALAYGITGNFMIAAISGDNMDRSTSCASIKGKGSLTTVAFKDRNGGTAFAGTNGSFRYAGQTNKGIVVGGGVTAGFSVVNVTANTATAISGGFTVSGVGNTGAGHNPQ